MGLITDREQVENYKTAFANIKQVQTWKIQFIEANTSIKALKAKIKTDVAGDVFDLKDMAALMKFTERRKAIIQRRGAAKEALIALKAKMNNADYENELQVEIDEL